MITAIVALSPAIAHASPSEQPKPRPNHHVHYGPNGEIDENLCDDPAPGFASCAARVRTDANAKAKRPARRGEASPANTVGNNGFYDPSYLQSAYNAPSATAGAGQTVAIVIAYNAPDLENDVATYRSFYGLPPCTTANGCFRKVDQWGGTSYPMTAWSWAREAALDAQMVSAMCPLCHILVVEAASNAWPDLGSAVNEAVALGANVVNNSYGGDEYGGESADSTRYYNHPGVAIVASTGDFGYGTSFPAAASNVTAVGGTTLQQATNGGTRNATETVWTGAGSGCSYLEAKPAWQQAITHCGTARSLADVSAVADPATGVWSYTSYRGWEGVGGTSAAAPIVASMYALAQNARGSSLQLAASPYGKPSALNDVISGSNCTSGWWGCNAGPGYDEPTGLGTPNGVAAFTLAAAAGGGAGTTTNTPQNVTAAPGNASVQLSWSSPSPATYNLYRGTTAGGETLYKSGTSTPSFADTGLTNGKTYYYKVTSVSSGKESPPSSEVKATPAGVPTAPQSVSARTASAGGVALTWKAPRSNGGSPVSGYVVLRSTTSNAETDYVSVACATSSCSYRDTGTTPNVTYYYKVVAVNAIGRGPLSSQSSAKAR